MWKSSEEIKNLFLGVKNTKNATPEEMLGYLLMFRKAVPLISTPDAMRVGVINAVIGHYDAKQKHLLHENSYRSEKGGLHIKWDSCLNGEEWELESFSPKDPMLYFVQPSILFKFEAFYITPVLNVVERAEFTLKQLDEFFINDKERKARNILGDYITGLNPNFKELASALLHIETPNEIVQLCVK